MVPACRCAGGPPQQTRSEKPRSGCRQGEVGEIRDLEGTVEVGGSMRGFVIDVPAGSASTPLPVVLSFHGIGGSAGMLREVTGMGEKAHDRGFVAVHPQGEIVWLRGRVGPGWHISAGWNRDVLFTRSLIDHLEASYCIDHSRIFAVGFSNGAHLAHVLACTVAEIDGAGAVGGGLREMASSCGPVRPVPVAIIHGSGDSVVDVEEGRAARDFWAERNGCTRSSPAGDLCTLHGGGSADVLYCEVEGLDHVWPLASQGDPLDATTTLLDFLLGWTAG